VLWDEFTGKPVVVSFVLRRTVEEDWLVVTFADVVEEDWLVVTFADVVKGEVSVDECDAVVADAVVVAVDVGEVSAVLPPIIRPS